MEVVLQQLNWLDLQVGQLLREILPRAQLAVLKYSTWGGLGPPHFSESSVTLPSFSEYIWGCFHLNTPKFVHSVAKCRFKTASLFAPGSSKMLECTVRCTCSLSYGCAFNLQSVGFFIHDSRETCDRYMGISTIVEADKLILCLDTEWTDQIRCI